jgi:hypothetical protein
VAGARRWLKHQGRPAIRDIYQNFGRRPQLHLNVTSFLSHNFANIVGRILAIQPPVRPARHNGDTR